MDGWSLIGGVNRKSWLVAAVILLAVVAFAVAAAPPSPAGNVTEAEHMLPVRHPVATVLAHVVFLLLILGFGVSARTSVFRTPFEK